MFSLKKFHLSLSFQDNKARVGEFKETHCIAYTSIIQYVETTLAYILDATYLLHSLGTNYYNYGCCESSLNGEKDPNHAIDFYFFLICQSVLIFGQERLFFGGFVCESE